jgi:hypothetical protein
MTCILKALEFLGQYQYTLFTGGVAVPGRMVNEHTHLGVSSIKK